MNENSVDYEATVYLVSVATSLESTLNDKIIKTRNSIIGILFLDFFSVWCFVIPHFVNLFTDARAVI